MRWGVPGHPAFAGAVAVLAVNDHVLKPLVGSWWTGKLSDVAGVFVVTAVAGAVIGRSRSTGVAVAVGFAAIKLVPAAALAVAPLLGGVTKTDATDLVALVAIVPAVRLVERPGEGLRRGFGVLAGVVAVLATTATSCAPPDAVDAFVVADDGSVAARSNLRWATSADGGQTWSRLDVAPEGPRSEVTEACAPAVGCFRVKGGEVQQRDRDAGRWRTAFAFTEDQRDRMSRRTACGQVGDPTVIALVDRPDGTYVVVGMEAQGVLHRRPDGQWERRPVLDLEPVSTWGPIWLGWLIVAPLAVMVLVPAVVLLASPRRRLLPALVALVGAGLVFLQGLVYLGLGGDYATGGLSIAAWSVAIFVISLVLAWLPRKSLVTGDPGPAP